MARKRIIGNWKMHGSAQQVDALLRDLLAASDTVPVGDLDIAVCPPSVYLERTARQLAGSVIGVGAQDVSAHPAGAFTGEICAEMLADVGCRYVIVGHSERRQYHGEDESLVASKLERVLAAGLIPVVCVGETLAQRQAGQALEVIDAQLQPVLDLERAHLAQVVLAYEPVWAIGTGETATPEQAGEVHAHIRCRLASQAPQTAAAVSVLYGGSVKAENARALFAQANIDGALVGGAALDAEQFTAIWLAAETWNLWNN